MRGNLLLQSGFLSKLQEWTECNCVVRGGRCRARVEISKLLFLSWTLSCSHRQFVQFTEKQKFVQIYFNKTGDFRRKTE
jgi:hypothetical protein